MEDCSVVGLDIAKNVFHAVGMSRSGKVLFRKRLRRDQLQEWSGNLGRTLIVMEACGGAHFWAREFGIVGHAVKLIAPQFVKPFVKSNKNDDRDAEAICEAASRPTMRFVTVKSQSQQELLMLHRSRQRVVKNRTALVNEIRGFLTELGIVFPKGVSQFRRNLLTLVEEQGEKFTSLSRQLFSRLLEEFLRIDDELSYYNQILSTISKQHPECARLCEVPGIGPMTATALVAAVGNPQDFKNGRQFSAYLGLVPRQHSSGGKNTLLGISKRGDPYLRQLLVHGARAVMRVAQKPKPAPSARERWIQELIARRGVHRTTVAIANKNARTVWALLAHQERYDAQHV